MLRVNGRAADSSDTNVTMDAIVTLAPTGMVPTRANSPHVPLTPAEIAADVARAMRLGITAVHLHARDIDGRPVWHRERYAEVIGRVKEVAPELVICVSTSGRDVSEVERRADCLAIDGDLKPDMASLTLSSLNFARQASINAPETVQELARIMNERGIVPELEIFDLGMANYACFLADRGLLPATRIANLFVGNIAGAQPTLGELGIMVDRLPPGTKWSAAGIGDAAPAAYAFALFAGGGVRVGLEDSLWLDRHRTKLARNIDLVERVHRLAEIAERPVMSPSIFRQMLRQK